uniref:Uncharacterized protein n=1 Tax=Picea glauca TaxID=3330 RepID=A0A101LUI4_PICGL|nr:hypothetical protein ABT39_MTgene2448 [Picea glauca]QHR88516.1 hypothetical protein Q903MT_gene2530 [Picea sitchensis]
MLYATGTMGLRRRTIGSPTQTVCSLIREKPSRLDGSRIGPRRMNKTMRGLYIGNRGAHSPS